MRLELEATASRLGGAAAGASAIVLLFYFSPLPIRLTAWFERRAYICPGRKAFLPQYGNTSPVPDRKLLGCVVAGCGE